MAITMTVLTQSKAASASSATTATVTLASGKEYRLLVGSQQNVGTPAIPTVSGWTQVNTLYDSSGIQTRVTSFRKAGDGSTGTQTIDFGGTTQQFIMWSVVEIGGSKTGAASSVQSATHLETSGGSTTQLPDASTLAAFADPTNNAALVFGNADSGNGALSEKTGYTNVMDQSDVPSNNYARGSYNIGQDLDPYQTTPIFARGAAVTEEIAAAAAVTLDTGDDRASIGARRTLPRVTPIFLRELVAA